MEFKKILYIDMDGVCADFEAGVRSYEPDMLWEQEEVDRVCEANPLVFEILPELSNAIKSIEILKNHYDIYFLSTPMCNVPESYMGKRKWLREKFGDWVDRRLILTHRKDLNKGDFIIDDRLVNGVEFFDGHHIHFGSEKFPDWESVLKFLINKIIWNQN